MKYEKFYISENIHFLNKSNWNTNAHKHTTKRFWNKGSDVFLKKKILTRHPSNVNDLLLEITSTFGNELFLRLQNNAITTIFVLTYAKISIEYHEIKLYDINIINYNHDLKQYFMENFKRISRCLRNTIKNRINNKTRWSLSDS